MSDKDDILFDRLLADQRYNELIGAIKSLIEEINTLDNKEKIEAFVEVVKKNSSDVIEAVRQAGENMKQPDVDIEVNQREVTQSIESMERSIVQKLGRIVDLIRENQPAKTWKFTVSRDWNGYIETVKAEQID